MEYTDAPSTQTADTMLCPNCGQRLPKDAQACDRCTWKRESPEVAEGTASDAMAALLSIIPGLGHVYKGYRGIGLLFAIGTLIVLGFSGLAAIASLRVFRQTQAAIRTKHRIRGLSGRSVCVFHQSK